MYDNGFITYICICIFTEQEMKRILQLKAHIFMMLYVIIKELKEIIFCLRLFYLMFYVYIIC